MTKLERAIEKAQRDFDKQIDAIAEDVRQRLVIPFCKKHRLCYRAGNGTFAFFPAKGHRARSRVVMGSPFGGVADAKRAGLHMKRLFAALETWVSVNSSIGDYVRDVGEPLP